MIPKKFREHELWDLLEKIDEFIKSLPPINFESDEDKETINSRLPLYISTVKKHKSNAAAYYSDDLLNAMHAKWSNIDNKLEWLEDSPSKAYEIDREIDEVAAYLATWPTAITLKGSAVNQTIKIFEETQSKWNDRIEYLEKSILDKDKELEKEQGRYINLRKEVDAEIDELYERLDENKQLINAQKEKIAAQAVEHSEHFESSQEKRRQNYKAWIEEQQEIVNAEARDILSGLEEHLAEGGQVLQNIEDLHESVEKAAHGATAVILARDYNTASKRDYLSGILFMILGVGLLITAGCILYRSFTSVTPESNITWQWTALKASATLLITVGATFSFKFSQSFLASASRFKRADLELRAINPFLANIGQKDLADQTKVDFINRSFGQPELPENNEKRKSDNKSSDEENFYKDMFEMLITAFRNGGK